MLKHQVVGQPQWSPIMDPNLSNNGRLNKSYNEHVGVTFSLACFKKWFTSWTLTQRFGFAGCAALHFLFVASGGPKCAQLVVLPGSSTTIPRITAPGCHGLIVSNDLTWGFLKIGSSKSWMVYYYKRCIWDNYGDPHLQKPPHADACQTPRLGCCCSWWYPSAQFHLALSKMPLHVTTHHSYWF